MGAVGSDLRALSAEEVIAHIAEYFQRRGYTLKDVFSFCFDTDRSGYITLDEFLRGVNVCLDSLGHTRVSPANLVRLFNRFDRNKDGRICIDEFAVAFGAPTVGATWDIISCVSRHPGGVPKPAPVLYYGDKLIEKTARDVIARIAGSLSRTGFSAVELFHRMDADASNTLSHAELERLVRTLEPSVSKTEVDAIFHRFDQDRSGYVDLREFCQTLQEEENAGASALVAVEDKVRVLGERLRRHNLGVDQLFRLFDRDGDNFLTREEWRRALGFLAEEIPAHDVEVVFGRFDLNGDGLMSISEFNNFFERAAIRPISHLSRGAVPAYTPPPAETAEATAALDQVRTVLQRSRAGLTMLDVFRRLDLTGSNSLTHEEFARLIRATFPTMSDAGVHALFQKVNVSGTGEIQPSEFVCRFG